jgi:hypothetical protein
MVSRLSIVASQSAVALALTQPMMMKRRKMNRFRESDVSGV